METVEDEEDIRYIRERIDCIEAPKNNIKESIKKINNCTAGQNYIYEHKEDIKKSIESIERYKTEIEKEKNQIGQQRNWR